MEGRSKPQDILESLKLPALILVLLILALEIALYWLVIPVTFEPPYLTLFLNVLFNGIPALIIGLISIRGFLRSGSWPVLWFGLGTVVFGFSTIVGGLLITFNSLNTAFTVSGLIFLMASVLHFVGALYIVYNIFPLGDKPRRLMVVWQVYLTAAVIIALSVILSIFEFLPPFYIPEQGGPLVQQMATGIAAAFFMTAGLFIIWRYRRTQFNFFYWYSLGLLLLFIGMMGLGVMKPTITLYATLYAWVGRSSQLLSGLFFLAAAVVMFQEARFWKISAEQAMVSFFQRQEANLRLLFESIAEAIIVTDRNFIISGWNKAAEDIFGWKAEEVIGKPVRIIMQDKWLPEIGEKNIQEGLRTNGSWKGEAVQKRKDGRDILVLSSISLIKDMFGNPAGTVNISTDITERKKAEEALLSAKNELETRVQERTQELAEVNEQLKQYARRITNVQEEERKRIAYELHDDTAQYLSILKLQLDSLLHSGEIQDPQVIEKIQYLEKDAGRAIDDVRRYSHELRPGVLEYLGLVAALEQIAEDVNKLGQIKVKIQVEGEEQELSEDVKLGFFRIAQEAINNARKHSQSSRVLINLDFHEDQVKMTVSDDGVGFEMKEVSARANMKGSLGLMSMQERAKLIDAKLTIESKTGQGTRVIVEKAL